MLGLGSNAPELRLTNEELSQRMDTNEDWIVSRTGIRERRSAVADQTTSLMSNGNDVIGILR